MKACYPLSLLLLMATMPGLVVSAALSGSGCETTAKDGSRSEQQKDNPCLASDLFFPFLLSTSPRYNNSCWTSSLSGWSWPNPPGSSSKDIVVDKLGRSPLKQPIKRETSSTTKISASTTVPPNLSPTPEPTGGSSPSTTVHITSERDFALLLPNREGELVSDAESDGVAFCTPGSTDASCGGRAMRDGFIRAAAIERAGDGSWIQVTGCIDPSKSFLDPSDDGGQMDVRFPQGAQCAFGGFGASFIEQIEPSNSRFCLRCCASANDQMNCNSHQDRAGCPTAIPGNYSFPAIGVDCS